MKYKTIKTLVKAGLYDNPLEKAVNNFPEQLKKVSVGLGNTIKYATFKDAGEPYLLMVSQQKDKLVSPAGYNVLLTITSYSDLRNHEIADQFEKETGINLDIEVSEQLKRFYEMIGMSFKFFEKDPKKVMDILTREPNIGRWN